MSIHQWPSREQWAKEQRTPYADLFEDVRPTSRAGAYISREEIADIIKRLAELWKAKGKQLQEAKRLAGHLAKQPKETRRSYSARWVAMNQQERELASEVEIIKGERQEINELIKSLAQDDEIKFWLVCGAEASAIQAGYDAAYKAAMEVREQQILATPIDDEAWERELRRRKDIDENGIIRIVKGPGSEEQAVDNN